MSVLVQVSRNRSLALAGGLFLCALTVGCEKPQPTAPKGDVTSAAATALPAEWEVPIQYRGDWHESLANCANAADLTRMQITVDRVTINGVEGQVKASSISGLQLTVVLKLPIEGQDAQRVFAFTLSPEQDKLTAVQDGPGITRSRCPAKA